MRWLAYCLGVDTTQEAGDTRREIKTTQANLARILPHLPQRDIEQGLENDDQEQTERALMKREDARSQAAEKYEQRWLTKLYRWWAMCLNSKVGLMQQDNVASQRKSSDDSTQSEASKTSENTGHILTDRSAESTPKEGSPAESKHPRLEIYPADASGLEDKPEYLSASSSSHFSISSDDEEKSSARSPSPTHSAQQIASVSGGVSFNGIDTASLISLQEASHISEEPADDQSEDTSSVASSDQPQSERSLSINSASSIFHYDSSSEQSDSEQEADELRGGEMAYVC